MPVACGRQRDAAMTRALLARGASPALCATLRKLLDWCETPRWHEAREVAPAKWGQGFPERGWVNLEVLRILEATVTLQEYLARARRMKLPDHKSLPMVRVKAANLL